MFRRLAVAMLLTLAATDASAQAPAAPAGLPSVELPSALDRVLRDYERAWEAKDPAALAALFTEDGFVLSNGRAPVRGRDAIRGAYKDGGGPLALRALAYSTEGALGYVIGAYAPVRGQEDAGKFVLVLRRGKDGRWLIAADMDNSNRSRSGPPPSMPRPPDPASVPAPPPAPQP